MVSAIHIFSRLNFTYYIPLLHGHANWDFETRNCLQIKFRFSRQIVEFLQVNFATSTHPFASILRWLFSIMILSLIFAVFRTQRVCFYFSFLWSKFDTNCFISGERKHEYELSQTCSRHLTSCAYIFLWFQRVPFHWNTSWRIATFSKTLLNFALIFHSFKEQHDISSAPL